MQIGKYRLIHKLATGGMAEVFLAKAAGPMGFEKLLVVKRILPHLATEPTFVEMFLTEARLAAQLNHPNIVQIFDFGEAEGSYFLAMEYIDGPNLREIVRRSSAVGLTLPLTFCARVVSAACEGLAFAHGFSDPITRQAMNIIHRDISPDNILLSRQGAVKVVDFGIAKAAGMSPHTQTGVLKGKLAYMSPEQLRNEPLDQRADVYALGVVLYELLTGLKPFIATSDAGMVQAVLFELQVPVVQRRPDVPEALQRILARALAKERERRYPDCHSFQAELEEFIISTGKPMGASQLAQIVSMMTAGVENPHPTVQTHSSAPSNPRLVMSPPPQRPLEPTAPSPERSPAGLELTAAARPSQLLIRNGGQPLQVPSSAGEPPPQPQALSKSPGHEKELAWVARVGIALFLAGGAVLIQTHPFKSSENLPPHAAPPVVAREDSGSKPPVDRPATPPAATVSEVQVDAGVVEPPKEVPSGPAPPGDGGVAPPVDFKHKRKRPQPAAEEGALELKVKPGAMLYLDGWQVGRVRDGPIPLSPGEHSVRLVNRELRKDVTRQFTIAAGKTLRLEINLFEEKSR